MKNQNFVVEVLESKDSERKYIIRTLQGQPITILNTANDVATFFDEFKFKSEDGK